MLSPTCIQTGVFLPARFRYCAQRVMGIPLNVVFARRFRPVPVFARTSIALCNKAQRTASHRGASARFSDAFVDDDDWRSRAGSSRACVPPVYLACTSSRRRAHAKRFRDRLCTACVLIVNEGTACRALLVGYKTPLFFWRTRRGSGARSDRAAPPSSGAEDPLGPPNQRARQRKPPASARRPWQ